MQRAETRWEKKNMEGGRPLMSPRVAAVTRAVGRRRRAIDDGPAPQNQTVWRLFDRQVGVGRARGRLASHSSHAGLAPTDGWTRSVMDSLTSQSEGTAKKDEIHIQHVGDYFHTCQRGGKKIIYYVPSLHRRGPSSPRLSLMMFAPPRWLRQNGNTKSRDPRRSLNPYSLWFNISMQIKHTKWIDLLWRWH